MKKNSGDFSIPPPLKHPIKSSTPCIIGLEIHVQLSTVTKLFCACPSQPKQGVPDEPNSRVCPVCLGHPGAKPVANEKAVKGALRIALALSCTISPSLIFSKKSYFYPDMSKNFQITQFEEPLGRLGGLSLDGKHITIKRVHLEEDPAALVHAGSHVLVDYNRSGNPLVEVVTEPELSSPDEAREFMKRLLTILEYLEVYDVSWCVLKADANISIAESNFTRVEIKNITGFKEIERALEFEVARQKAQCTEGKRIVFETRGWDAEKGLTYPLREKESEEDYGYIVDPDLIPIPLPDSMIDLERQSLPELSQAKAARFMEMGVKPDDARIIAGDRAIAELFEQVAKEADPVLAGKWIRRELMRVLNFSKKTLQKSGISKHHLIDLLNLVKQKKITEATAQKLMERIVDKPFDICKVVEQESLGAIADEPVLIDACTWAIGQCRQAVEDYKRGEKKAFHFIVGKVMAKTKGTADPGQVKRMLLHLLK